MTQNILCHSRRSSFGDHLWQGAGLPTRESRIPQHLGDEAQKGATVGGGSEQVQPYIALKAWQVKSSHFFPPSWNICYKFLIWLWMCNKCGVDYMRWSTNPSLVHWRRALCGVLL
jgi:hypothetical protein